MATIAYPPFVKKLHLAGSVGASGNNPLIPAPKDGNEIVIGHFYLQNTTAVPTVARLLAGSFQFFVRAFPALGDGYGVVYPQGLEDRLGLGNPLILNLNGANAFHVVIGYWLDTKL